METNKVRHPARLVTLVSALALASAAVAQGTMTFVWTVGDTGNNDGIVEPGEIILLDLFATMDPGAVGFAGSIYDIVGNERWAQGTVLVHDNLLDGLTDDGAVQGNNNITGIESFQLPPLFNPDFDASNPIHLYHIEWIPTVYDEGTMTGTTIHLNSDVYIDEFGSSVPYERVVNSFTFDIVPCPSSAAALGVCALCSIRRRRSPS